MDRKNYLADAYMHTGNYADAKRVFEEVLTEGKARLNSDNPTAGYQDIVDSIVKLNCLEVIAVALAINNQIRKPKAAFRILSDRRDNESDAEMLVRCENALREDALCGDAWFNRGVALDKQGKFDAAMLSFLAAAAVRTGDNEAWLRTILSGMACRSELLPTVIIYIQQHIGLPFVQYVATVVRCCGDSVKREFLLKLSSLLTENTPKAENFIVRSHGKDGHTTMQLNVCRLKT